MKPSFKINKKAYSFQDITIRTYYQLLEILKTEDKDKEFQVVQCLTGCPVAELKRLPFQDWMVVWDESCLQVETLNQGTDAISPILEFNKTKWGLPPVQDITVGEFADLEIFFAQKDSGARLHEVAAMIYRPIVKQKGEQIKVEPYDAEKVPQRAETFLDAPLSVVRSANAFFLQSADSLLRNTADSLLQKMGSKTLPQDVQESLHRLLQLDLGGILSTTLQEEILYTLQKQPSSRFAKLSTGLAGRRTRFVDTIWPFRRKQNTK